MVVVVSVVRPLAGLSSSHVVDAGAPVRNLVGAPGGFASRRHRSGVRGVLLACRGRDDVSATQGIRITETHYVKSFSARAT